MKLRKVVFILGICLSAEATFAQDVTARDIALNAGACSGRNIVDARWMRDGSLKVVCDRRGRKRADGNAPKVTAGATNVVGLLAPALGLGAAVAAVAGGSSSPSATSSTGQH